MPFAERSTFTTHTSPIAVLQPLLALRPATCADTHFGYARASTAVAPTVSLGPTAEGGQARCESGGSMTTPSDCYLTTKEAARHLRLSPRTLEKMRGIGNGPRFCKFGRRVLYARAVLDTWAAGHSHDST